MPLIFPVLRLAVLSLNVYDTLKTIKSRRNGAQLSARALTRRKRDMKGCLSVWVVWCCLAAYERMLNGVVGLVLPFHDEVKSVIMLFLLVTRSRGAEPIFLHIIRPLLKPHTDSLDLILDFLRMIGDILFVMAASPFSIPLTWWRNRAPQSALAVDMGTIADRFSIAPDRQPLARSQSRTYRPPGPGQHERVTTDPSSDRRKRALLRPSSSQGGSATQARRQSTDSLPGSAGTQIWYPPATAYAANNRIPPENMPLPLVTSNPVTGPTPPSTPPSTSQPLDPEQANVEEWRLYPPFPSAYPPTPLPPSSSLPRSRGSSAPQELQQGVVEEWRLYPPFPSAYPPTPLPVPSNLPRSRDSSGPTPVGPFPPMCEGQETLDPFLEPPREPAASPSSSDSSGNHRTLVRINSTLPMETDTNDGDDDDDGDDDEDDDDDEFSLRTPPPLAGSIPGRPPVRRRTSSLSSARSRATALTTVDDGSSTSSSLSLTPAPVGYKRASPGQDVADVTIRARAVVRTAPPVRQNPKPATWSYHTRGGIVPEVLPGNTDDDASEVLEGAVSSTQVTELGMKRQRITGPAMAPSLPASTRATRNRRPPQVKQGQPARPQAPAAEPQPQPRPTQTSQAATRMSARLANARPIGAPVSGNTSQDSGTVRSTKGGRR